MFAIAGFHFHSPHLGQSHVSVFWDLLVPKYLKNIFVERNHNTYELFPHFPIDTTIHMIYSIKLLWSPYTGEIFCFHFMELSQIN